MIYFPIRNFQFSTKMLMDQFVKYIAYHSFLSIQEVYLAGRMLARAENQKELMIVIMSVNAERNPIKK